jgi:hypothetical protein
VLVIREEMHMKKIVALPLIAALALGVAACKKSEDTAANNADVSADLNASANDAMADVNAATDNSLEAGNVAADNAGAVEANSTNAQ